MDISPLAALAAIGDGGHFEEFAAILILSAVFGAAAIILRQPLIISFIVVGVVAGPTGLDLLAEDETWDLLATIGIAVLLFVVGLKLDLDVVRKTGPVALATGLGQVAFTSGIGLLLCLLLGLTLVHAVYVAVALTFSSTIIIVKLLSDKREIDSLHGRIAVGFLIVQDIVVVLVMIGLASAGDAGDVPLAETVVLVVLKGAGLLAVLGLLMRFVLPKVLELIARSPELLVLAAIGWAATMAVVASEMGFSEEVGAFLAGFSLASTPFREAISSRLVSLRDFLLLFFFITLGAGLDFGELGEQILPAVVLSLFVLIGNPIIVMVIMGALGYRRRTGFLAGLTVAQISEFSLILGALGVTLGHLSSDRLGLITLVGLITIGLSTYMILYSHRLYELLAPYLRIFERQVPHAEGDDEELETLDVDIVLFGYGRFGSNIARELHSRGAKLLVVDFDPQAIRYAEAQGMLTHYGDAEDPEFHAHLPLSRVSWVVGTIPDIAANRALMRGLEHHGYTGNVALTAHNELDALLLEQEGAHLLLLPFVDAAREAADELSERIGFGGAPSAEQVD